MTFHSRANPDQRRRRVLLDETRNDESLAVAPPRAVRRDKRYPDDALAQAQPRVTDFLPARWQTLALLLLGALCIDGAIGALGWYRYEWSIQLPEATLAVLDAAWGDSAASLWLTLKCCTATVVCLLIFAIRRRRLDDLRGTYRVWIWAALFAALFVPLASTAVEEIIIYGITCIPQMPAISPPRAYLWLVLGVLFGPMTLRLLIEMRRVRLAQILLIVAVLLAAGSESVFLMTLTNRLGETLAAALRLVAATSLCGALATYGRYVKLDAQGVFGRRRKKRKDKKVEEESDDEAEAEEPPSRIRTDLPSMSAAARPNSIGAAITAARTSSPDDDRRGAPLSKSNRDKYRR